MKKRKLSKLYYIAVAVAVCVLSLCFMTACNDTPEEKQKVFVENDVEYNVVGLKVIGNNFTELADSQKSVIKLTKEGDLEIRIVPKESTVNLANVALSVVYANNPDGIDIAGFEKFVYGLFPTESYADMKKAFGRLQKDLGVTFEGLDYDSEPIKKVLEGIKTDGAVQSLVVPKDFALSIKGKYEIKTISSKTQENDFQAVYLGEYRENGDPYLILTMFKDEEGRESIRVRNEILALDIVATVLPSVPTESN